MFWGDGSELLRWGREGRNERFELKWVNFASMRVGCVLLPECAAPVGRMHEP